MREWYIEYSLWGDESRYCTYHMADSKEDAIRWMQDIESQLKAIYRCEPIATIEELFG